MDAALTASGRTLESVTLSWPAASDDTGVSGYNIYKDGTLASTIAGSANSTSVAGLTAGTNYTFGVEAFDGNGNLSSRLTVSTDTNNRLKITTQTLPSAIIGNAYNGSGAALSASGGAEAYIWSAEGLDGSELSISADGIISGTPASTGTWMADVAVTDSSGAFTSKSFIINVYYPAGAGKYTVTPVQAIVMVMKAYGIKPDETAKDNFADAGNTYYTNYLAAAKRLGLTNGIGNNLYAPGKEITQQEMISLSYKTLKIMGELPTGTKGKDLTAYTDSNQIAPWAKEAMTLFVKAGITTGSGKWI